ncbi:sugar phosphate isomerase/epimerase [Rhodoferax sp.]|uniref:sugar phosphate isomerase/epimerase family protein n=1 Tax=Rhodoferax sp. TaxID=50421 RepID=UPI0025FD13D0|nr:sugar phosphate isomerase/epimerase [Rhodoferax sp.]
MKISVQIYSLREAGDLDVQLALARSCGFTWVETVATHGLTPQAFADKVAAHGLQVSSMHAALALLETDIATVIEACRLTGCPLVVMPWLPMGERSPTAAGFVALGQRLAALGDALRAHGVQLAYHNHDFEFLPYEGRTALEWIFSAATPAQLGWEADLGWVSRAGADPQVWLDKFADRLVAVHAKDIAPPRMALEEDGWTTLGQGIVPWVALLAQLKTRTNLVVFEHDHPVDFASTLRNSHAFLTQHLSNT